ncbi:hypothetical protein EIM92_18675 [Paenibacillus lentus]|uniref:Uncharacterized protein n=2 Tax=Paenibacillus lentus TaxID=1338368 RepID=A0A3Q8SEY3_9BACL|nr:hypothetical protein EIM92_18675 [Paenibacillus lentus]
MIFLLAIVTLYIFLIEMNNFMSESKLNKKIQVKQVAKTEMFKALYIRNESGVFVDWIKVELSEVDINNIVNWINSVPDSDVIELNQMQSNTNISTGIVFRLKDRNEIRIQYDLERIYITRTDVRTDQVIYTITQKNLKEFLDKQLKGFYFGEDKVKKFLM